MSAISLKSITGITSITTPAGVDNQLTLHNNNTTEAVKLDIAGNVHVNNQLAVAGVSTLGTSSSGQVTLQYQGGQRLKTHNWGVEVSNTLSATNIVATAANSSFAGASFTSAIDANGDLDVDGHTNLDNVNIAGVTTTSGDLFVDGNVVIPSSGRYFKLWTGGTQGITLNHGGTYGELDNLTGMMRIKAGSVNLANRFGNYNFINCAANGSVDLYYDAQNHTTPKLATSATGVTIDGTAVAGGLDISGDIDVDGQTDLDNVSIAGVTTATGLVNININASQSVSNPLLLQNSAAAGNGSNPDVVKLAFGSQGSVKASIRADVYGNGAMTFHTNNDTEKLRITAGGSVNIGGDYTQTTYKLRVSGTSYLGGVVRVPNGSAAAPAIHFGDSDSGVYGDSSNGVRLTASGSDTIVATSNGVTFPIKATALTSFTLGSQSALSKPLYFADAASVQSASILLDNSSQELRIKNGRFSGQITFTTYNTERLRITSSGKVGINTTNPQDELHIESADPAIRLSDSANGQYAFIDGNSGNLVLHSDKGASGGSSSVKFAVDNSVKMTLDHNGHLDLATGNLQFANGAGLDFSNVPASGNTLTTDGNKLDDYEEGVYTPTATTGAGGNISGTTSFSLRYVKVGRLVHIVGRLHFSTSANNLSSLSLSLPFTNTAGNQHDTSVCTHVIRGNGGDPVQGIRIFRIGPGSTTMYMQNHEGQNYGDLGTTSPHININFSYFAA